jgi:RIO-like serine/threonine protein kinase
MVVKDFAKHSWWRRLIGRLEIDRECRAYEYLGPMPCIPSFIGRIDRDALAVEKVEGISLRLVDDIDERRDTYLGQMRTAMERLTELGFLHLDARAYRNVLRRPDGRVVFIDLAGSFWIPPGHFGYRLLRRFTAIYYEANLIKWETMLAPGGDPRIGQARPPRYVHGIADFWLAWKRLRERRSTVQQ